MPTPESAAPCPECGGRGWIVHPDGGAGTAKPCDCRHDGVIPRLIAAAGVPTRYAQCRLDKFQVDQSGFRGPLERARATAVRYVDDFLAADGSFRESGLIFIGSPGVGKTHLAVATLFELIDRYRVRGRFVDFTTLIYDIQATFDPRSPESKQAIMDPVMDAEVLILDELGAQKPSPWVSEILYLILNTRYTSRLPTLFTTNYRLPADEPPPSDTNAGIGREGLDLLTSRIPAMLVSRLFEMAQPVEIESRDYRQLVMMHQHRV